MNFFNFLGNYFGLLIFAKMKNNKKYFLLINLLLIAFVYKSYAQSLFINNDKNSITNYENNIYQNSYNHTVIRPIMLNEIYNSNYFDSSYFKANKSKTINWLTNKNFIYLKNKNNGLIINPILSNIFNSNNKYYSENGLQTNAWLGKNLAFSFSYSYIALKPSNEIKLFTDTTGILPHFGRVNMNAGYLALHSLTGYLSWQVADFMNIQIGKDKSFWGDGYRSLLLSDNSNASPFFKGTVNIWKVKYIILYSFLKEKLLPGFISPLENKYSASHILSWNIGKRLNFNMFETVVWQGKDSLGNRGFDVNYLNPIIFYRPVEFSLGSPDNVIMGFGGRLRIFKTTHLYGQFLLDEFKLSELKANKGWWANKFGIQAGIKTFNLFGIKNLYALGEINIVKPYTYSHWTYMDNYGNFSQPLAHPLGANFAEGITNIHYQKNRWDINSLIKIYKIGVDKDSLNVGNNIYRSYLDNVNEYGNKLLQGYKHNIKVIDISLGYIINPKWNLYLKLGYRITNDNYLLNTTPTTYNFQMVYFGLYTAIGNREGLY